MTVSAKTLGADEFEALASSLEAALWEIVRPISAAEARSLPPKPIVIYGTSVHHSDT